MKKSNVPFRAVGMAASALLLLTFTGCTTYVARPAPRVVVMPPPPPPPPVIEEQPVVVAPPQVVIVPPAEPTVVVIHSESDFYTPLSPYGQWVEVPGYGRCWRPAQVASTWRPYVNGHWDRTDAGWYWNSDEPWAWATYHYGRWDFSAQFGWVWMPQTQWAPAWVSWREGAGYVGWAPLPPSARFNASVLDVRAPAPAARHFVFVPEQRMMEPVHAQTVIVNNTTVINQTVNITNVRVENKTVINEGPRVQEIERRTGRQLPTARVNDLRRRDESVALARQHNVTPSREERPPEPARPVTRPNPPQRELRLPESPRNPAPPQTPGRQYDNRPPVVQNPPVQQGAEPRRPEPIVLQRPGENRPVPPTNPPQREVRQPEPPRNPVPSQTPGQQYDSRPPVVQNPPVHPMPEPRRQELVTPPRQVESRPVTPAPNPVITRPVPVRPEPQPAPVVIPQPPVTRPVPSRVEPQSPAARPAPPVVIAPPVHTVPVRTEPAKPARIEPPTVVKRPEVRPEPAPQPPRAATLRKAAQQQVRNKPHTPAQKPVVVQLHGTNVVVTPGVTNAPEFKPSTREPRRR